MVRIPAAGGGGLRPRRQRRAAGAALLAAAALAGALANREARAAFVVSYEPPLTADYGIYFDELRHEHFLESVSLELNRVLALPDSVTLKIAECGHSTTTWSEATRVVTVCYEFLDAVLAIAGEAAASQERAEQLFSGAVTFALIGEVGRALVAQYALPADRGLERAGDEFAAITLAAAERDGDPSAAAALEFFDAALRQPDAGFEYLESHAFDRARLEDVACLLSGNAPTNHAEALAQGLVPPERAARCAEELVTAARAWEQNLRAHAPPPAPATQL